MADEPEFPRELARCTCGTPSHDPDDHANGCRLSPTLPLATTAGRPYLGHL